MNRDVVVENLRVTYSSWRGATEALAGVSLTLREPAIVGLVGRNRAGKSTLLRVLAGREPRYSGEATVFGLSAPRAMGRAIVAGDRWPFAAGQTFKTLARHLGRFGVDPRSSVQSRGSVSSGLACLALAARAPLTMLDEPMLGMDAPSRKTIAEIVVEEQADEPRIIVMSTHLIDEVADLFERVLVLEGGRLRADADPSTLVSRYRRVEGSHDEVARLRVVGDLARLGNRAEAIVEAEGLPTAVRAYPVGLQDLVTALTDPSSGGRLS
jgi:ABC-2 type transport system ATP-binding protein